MHEQDSAISCWHGDPRNANILLAGTSEPRAKTLHDCVSRLPALIPLTYSVGCAENVTLKSQTAISLMLPWSALLSSFRLLPTQTKGTCRRIDCFYLAANFWEEGATREVSFHVVPSKTLWLSDCSWTEAQKLSL